MNVFVPRTGPVRRFLSARLLSVALSFLSVPAVGGWIEDREDGSTVIHVKVFELPDPSRREPSQRAEVAAVQEFVRRFPERFERLYRERYRHDPDRYGRHNWDRVEVELHQYSGIKIGNLGGRVGIGNLLAVAGRVAPDVMYVNFRQSGTYIHEGFLYPLDRPEDGYLAGMTEEEKAFRIHPKTWPVIRQRGPDGAEHVWAMPYGGALGKVLLYRKDLFDEAGLPYPGNDWTWEDLLRFSRALTDPARGRYGLYLAQSQHEAAYWLTFLWSAGGDVLREGAGPARWEAAFDSDAGAVALDFYTRLCTEPWTDRQGRKRYGYVWTDPALADAKWNRGEIGMQFSYIDEKVFAEINPDVTGMVPVPGGPGGLRGAELNSRMMGLFAGIDEPAVRDAAWEYIRFYDSEDAARIKTQIMVEGGFGPFLNPRDLVRFGYGDLVRLSPRGWKECFAIAIENSRPEPYAQNCNAIYHELTQPIREARERALRGDLPEGGAARLAALRTLLGRSARRVNERLLGVTPPDVLARRRVGAAAALLCIGGAFILFLRRAVRHFTPPAEPGCRRPRWGFRKYAWAYLLLLPAALTILLWHYIPLARGLVIGFQDYKIMGGSTWIGLDNFAGVLWNPDWWMAVWNSVRYSVLVIVLTFLPPAILAIFLQEIPVGRILFRTLYYLPAVITSLVTVLLWKSFYDKTEQGALNALVMRVPAGAYLAGGAVLLAAGLGFSVRLWRHRKPWAGAVFAAAGIAVAYTLASIAWPILCQPGAPFLQRLLLTRPEPYRWLDDPDTAMFCCVLPMAWAGIGPGCLIYLAALKSIPDDLYEVADLDGAGFVDKLLFVVFPVLKPLLVINFVGVFIASWNAAANILAMTDGAANTEVAGLHIFHQAFVNLRFGPATAMAWILGFLLIGFTVNQLRMLSRMEFRTVEDKR